MISFGYPLTISFIDKTVKYTRGEQFHHFFTINAMLLSQRHRLSNRLNTGLQQANAMTGRYIKELNIERKQGTEINNLQQSRNCRIV